MQLSARGARLRAAIEDATGMDQAAVERVGPSRVRISAPIAETATLAAFRVALEVVQRGDDWGSEGEPGAVVVWTEVIETPRNEP